MPAERSFLTTLGRRLVAARWLVVAAALLVAAAAYLGLGGLRVGFSIQGFFESDDPELRRALAHYRDFDTPDSMVLFGWPEAQPLAAASLDRLRRFRAAAERSPAVRAVFTLESAPLPGNGTPDPAGRARSHTFRHLLLGRHGDALGGVIHLGRRGGDWDLVRDLLQDLRAHACESGLDLRLCGIPVHRYGSVVVVQRDLATVLPLGTAMAVVFLFLLIPHWVLALQALAVVPLTLLCTLATMSWCGVEITMLTSMLPTLLLCMSVADGVHMVGRFSEERAAGHEPGPAAVRTLGALGLPCLMTSLTTVAGFLSLCAADLRDLRELGAFAAVGMGYAFLFTVTLLPALMSFVRGKPVVRRVDPAAVVLGWARRAATVAPWRWLLPAAGLLVAFLFLAAQVKSDHRMTADLWDSSRQMQDMRWYEANFVAMMPAEVLVAGPAGFTGSAALAELAALHDSLANLPGVSRALSVVDLWRDGAGPLVLRSAAALGLMPAGLLDREAGTARVLLFRGDLGTEEWHAFDRAVGDIAGRFPSFDVSLVGLPVVGTAQVEAMVGDLVRSFFGSVVVIWILMSLQCRSLRLGLLGMLPCLLALLGVLAVMAVSGVTLRPLTVTPFCIAFGLMVDDTVHLLARYREERRRGRSADQAVALAIDTAGRPVVVTTILLLVGFLSVLSSGFKGSFTFGVMVGLALLFALASALWLLPALLRAFGGRGVRA